MSETLVRVRDVHKYFTRGSERIDVLKGVNLDIPRGEFLALMGPSGSGKTTLLNLIGGLDAPTGGDVEVNGVKISTLGGGQLSRWRWPPESWVGMRPASPSSCTSRSSSNTRRWTSVSTGRSRRVFTRIPNATFSNTFMCRNSA